jgi:aspartyl-tRNA(Asn)/glutamyl-tRNA(Gln) amidotransferase subunit C
MSVSRDQVEQMAALARLRLSGTEVDRFADQLGDILDHAAELAAVDIGDEDTSVAVEPAPLRADERATDPLQIPPATLAPAWSGGFFTVPRLAAMDGGEGSE